MKTSTVPLVFFRLILLFLWICQSCSDATTVISDPEMTLGEMEGACSIKKINERKIRAKCSDDFFFHLLPSLYSKDLEILEVEGIRMDFLPEVILLPPTLHRLRLYQIEVGFIDFNQINISGNLLHLEIHDCSTIFSWKFSYGMLDQLTHLVIEDSNLFLIQSGMKFFSALKFLEIRNSRVYWIHLDALSQSKELRLLCLSGNNLDHFSRNYLPDPALHLWHLDLSYNRIESLPKDLLYRMPQLREFKVDHNLLKKLPDESGFPPHLKELWIQGNKLCSTYRNHSCHQYSV